MVRQLKRPTIFTAISTISRLHAIQRSASARALASLAYLTVTRTSFDLIVAGGNNKFKRPEACACAWINGKMTSVFLAIKVINSFVENKGDCSGRFLIRIETDAGVFKVSSIFVKNLIWNLRYGTRVSETKYDQYSTPYIPGVFLIHTFSVDKYRRHTILSGNPYPHLKCGYRPRVK